MDSVVHKWPKYAQKNIEVLEMLLLQNGILHTMEARGTVKADLLAADGKILKISNRIEPTERMQLYDAAGKHVYPGFIDAHSHIGISEEKTGRQGDDCNESSVPSPLICAR